MAPPLLCAHKFFSLLIDKDLCEIWKFTSTKKKKPGGKKSWHLALSVCKIKLYTFKTLISHNRKLTSQKAAEKNPDADQLSTTFQMHTNQQQQQQQGWRCCSRQTVHLTARETSPEDAAHRWWQNVKQKRI